MKEQYSDGIFCVGPQYGFLPCFAPLERLCSTYAPVQRVIDLLPVELTKIPGKMEEAIASMANLDEVCKAEEDKATLAALFRAYTFLCSGYLLAPAHFNKDAAGNYGKAHRLLPKQIAQPLVTVSAKLDVYPFLDYHYAYSLGNYVRINPAGNLHWNNLKMACSFTGSSDEVGFIMNHVYIEEKSPDLLRGIFDAFNDKAGGLELVYETIKEMNDRRRTMWTASNHKNYNSFRAFIMGIQGNEEIFGEGVVYEGCGPEARQYRGQTGAQDDVIPTLDIFTGVIGHYPDNMLTKYLLDLRQYRPKCVQAFFQDLEAEAPGLLARIDARGDHESLITLLRIVEQIYYFRNGHWQFVQKYIMANTKYAKATGGTPIISWIPNQIDAVLKYMSVLVEKIGSRGATNEHFKKVVEGLGEKNKLLDMQLEELKSIDYNVERIFKFNETVGQRFNLDDTKVDKF